MSLKRILATAVCAAALALGVSACGGGGGTLDPAVGQRADIVKAIAAADAAVGALDENAADAAVDAAVAALAAAKRAVEEADAIPAAEESGFEATIGRIEEELGRARSAIAVAREERRRRMAAERIKLTAALASAARISAIGARVAHGAAPVMSGTVPGTPPTSVAGLETAPRGEASTAGGWTGRSWRAADNASGTIDTVVLWTDIEAPGSRPFSGEGGKYDATNGLAADGSLPIGAGTDAALIASPEFPTTAGIRTHMAGTDGTVRIAGSFDGAAGDYVCAPTGQSPCTSSVRHGGGVALAGGGGWTFVPAPGATVAVPDGEYRYFGWWLRDTGAAHAVGVFHAGIGGAPDEFSGLAALQGPASYRGPAAGQFALSPPLGAAAAGEFAASVVLRAEFGDATDPGTVEGTVDGFTVDGEPMPWSVTLGRSGIGADGSLSAGGANTARTVWSIEGVAGSAPGTPPTWQGQLHDVNAQQVPSAATGAFEAAYGDIGRMVGAFGATLQQQ